MQKIIFFALALLCPFLSKGQESTSLYDKAFNLPDKFFASIEAKSQKLQQKVLSATERYIDKLAKQELKMQRRLARKDSAAANEIFGNVQERYALLRTKLKGNDSDLQQAYSPHIDSMTTALNFLDDQKLFSAAPAIQARMNGAYKNYGAVQGRLNQANFITEELRSRQQYLTSKLQSHGLGKPYAAFKKQVYYYRAQIDEYKRLFEDPQKLESALLAAVSKVPMFQSFFAANAALGTVFQLPAAAMVSTAALNGMQTRQLLMQELGQRLGAGPSTQGFVSNNITTAQSSLRDMKSKLKDSYGNGNPDMPDFKPNDQKKRSFLKRIEVGTNFQSTKSDLFFPMTTDIGLSLGYRLRSNITAGVGGMYKLGLGRGFRHIAVSHEGAGLRTFAEVKLKGSFWLSGGGEFSYRSRFETIEELKNYNGWQKSALLGMSKKYQLTKKLKGNMQLLYDFLHSEHVPATPPVLFRLGYNLSR